LASEAETSSIRFKALGWYLDDLVLTSVNDLTRRERKAKCRAAQDGLADRIAEYEPLAIVTLLLGIKKIVEAAAIAHQTRFRDEMARIVPALPRAG
jgi:hypothetical protein